VKGGTTVLAVVPELPVAEKLSAATVVA
jgi:hypothetical protein